jgi:hypothetical protein
MLGRDVTYKSREEFDALDDKEKLEYVKTKISDAIQEYIRENEANETITSRFSLSHLNSWRATATGAEGKARAISFQNFISGINTSLDDLLRALRDNLNEALKKNSYKTVYYFPIQVTKQAFTLFANNVLPASYKPVPGPKDLLGNSSVLAERVALTLNDIFNVDKDERFRMKEEFTVAGAVHPELAASIHFFGVEMKALEAKKRQAVNLSSSGGLFVSATSMASASSLAASSSATSGSDVVSEEERVATETLLSLRRSASSNG